MVSPVWEEEKTRVTSKGEKNNKEQIETKKIMIKLYYKPD